MAGNDIVFQLTIDADPAAVHKAVAGPEETRGWWTHDARQEGERAVLVFPGAEAPYDFTIDADAAERVAWTTVDHPPNWQGTTISFDLAAGEEGGTAVFFRHGEFADDGERGMIAFVWAQILGRLKAYVETGTAQPFFGAG